jgi:hypothetical protein
MMDVSDNNEDNIRMHLVDEQVAQRGEGGAQRLGLVRQRALVVPQQIRRPLHLLRWAGLQEALQDSKICRFQQRSAPPNSACC